MSRLARDRAGNTLALVAAGIVPILAMVGSGVDMGRSYLSQSRLQQACDAGVLAARKRLGTSAIVEGEVPEEVAEIGQRFFNINFRDGSYGTEKRVFQMTLGEDYQISGVASVEVPTAVMNVFGFDEVPITVKCEAQLSVTNTDVMMVLDTTGSMNDVLSGDTKSKIEVLRDVVKRFYSQLAGTGSSTARLRLGFVPFSSNVNVGYLLKSGWMVDSWTYNSREVKKGGSDNKLDAFNNVITQVFSGTATAIEPYAATKCPKDTVTTKKIWHIYIKNGIWKEYGEMLSNGIDYECVTKDGILYVSGTSYDNYDYEYWQHDKNYDPGPNAQWLYDFIGYDVSYLKGATDQDLMVGGTMELDIGGLTALAPDALTVTFPGCIEERDTYEISDYTNVDFNNALDLDIDLVPDSSKPETQWRPMLPELSYLRRIELDGSGGLLPSQSITPLPYMTAPMLSAAACPHAARKLSTITETELDAYLADLKPSGSTYPDIGMIWGGRLISPTGIFADENADVSANQPTARHLIFLTDGKTAPIDIGYTAYGVEGLEDRRWSKNSSLSLKETVNQRFYVACNEVKKRNVTVWVIGFGTELEDVFKQCAGDGKYFEVEDADTLDGAFAAIAKQIGDLRVTR